MFWRVIQSVTQILTKKMPNQNNMIRHFFLEKTNLVIHIHLQYLDLRQRKQ